MINSIWPLSGWKMNREILWSLGIIFMGACLLCFPLKNVAVILFLGVYVVATFARPQWPIYFLIILTPISRIPGMGELIQPTLLSMIFLSILIWFIQLQVSTKKDKWAFLQFKEFHLFFILFTLLMLISLVGSLDIVESSRMLAIHMAVFLSMYYFLDVLRVEAYLKKALYLFLCFSLLNALLALLQYAIMVHHVFIGLTPYVIPGIHRFALFANNNGIADSYRSTGTFFHPNNLGAYLALSLPVFLSMLSSIRNVLGRCFIVGAAGIVVLGIFSSGSRGSLMNMIVSSLFLLAIYWKALSTRIKIYGAILAVLMTAVFSSPVVAFLRFSSGLSNRDIIWQNATTLIGEHPLVGHGMGTFPQESFSRFLTPSVHDLQYILNRILVEGNTGVLKTIHAHNVFLNYAFEMGVAAPIVFLLFYGNYLRTFLVFIKTHHNDGSLNFALIVGAMAALLGQFVHNFFESNGFNILPLSYSFIFIAAMGIILMHKPTAHNKSKNLYGHS